MIAVEYIESGGRVSDFEVEELYETLKALRHRVGGHIAVMGSKIFVVLVGPRPTTHAESVSQLVGYVKCISEGELYD